MSEDLKAQVESILGLPVGPSTETFKAVTGEPYVTLCSGGAKKEGGSVPAWYATHDLARDAYLRTVRQYGDAQGRGVLYWRTPPEMDSVTVQAVDEHQTKEHVTLYSVYSRLLISDKKPEPYADPRMSVRIDCKPDMVVFGNAYAVTPLDLLEAADTWRRLAREKGWRLYDHFGREVERKAS